MLPAFPVLEDDASSAVDESYVGSSSPSDVFHEVFFQPPLSWWLEQEGSIEVVVLTDDLPALHYWQSSEGLLTKQKEGVGELIESDLEILQSRLQHRLVEIPAMRISELSKLPGIRSLTQPLPEADVYDTYSPQPATVKAKDIHGASNAWSLNSTGQGVKVAIVDSGVDFAHPDLNGTQARVDNSSSPWDGWPIALDPRSIKDWLLDGETYPGESDSWYADTSLMDFDNDSDSSLDDSGLDVSGIVSQSGEFRIGEHPDDDLQSRVGDDVAILLVDSFQANVYDTVYVDLDGDSSFADEIPMSKGSETAGLDLDGDGLWDRSGGMIYFIADGNTSVQYAPTLAARFGVSDRIPDNGDMVAFMLNEGNGPAGNHGTLCASAVSAQAIVSDGKVQGMAPDADIIAVGNYYNGGISGYDSWRYVAEGPDGIIDSGDEAHIGSFSFGYSSIVDAGSDYASMYLDWLTRVYSRNTTYMVALGNGGHGYGTVASPGGAAGVVSVGAASSKTGESIGDTWGDTAMWTNRGPNSQGRMDPDIVAIGWSATGDTTLNEETNANSAYTTWGGTSLATPLAAGLMALVYQAYFVENGHYPDSQKIRDLVMSTSRDIAHDPLVQGAGWFDAYRAVQTIQGADETWWTSPAALMPGENDGDHRLANANWMLPGERSVHRIQLHNPTADTQVLDFSSETWQATSYENFTWLSNSSLGWDGYQSSRPDYVIPLLIDGDANNTTISPTDTLIRARATVHPLGFDGNQNRQSENSVYLYAYRWNDSNGDGKYWDDVDNDFFVGDGEWQSSEVSLMTSFTYTGPQSEVKVSDPWEEDCDGILLAVTRREVRTGYIDPLPVSIDVTGFSPVSDSWLTTQPSRTIPAGAIRNLTVVVDVPIDAVPGLRQSGIRIADEHGRDWLLPVVTTVAGSGPTSWTPPNVDDNLSNQTLYRETWMQGAQRWGWRAESGDWKAFAVDWPANMSGGKIIIDVDWPDNGFTDIDAFWLSEISHPFSLEDPDAYGAKGLSIEVGSENEHTGSGIWKRQTSTGTDREILTASATPGHKILLLHSTMHGVFTNDNPVNVSIGYAALISGNISANVSDWSTGDFNSSAVFASTVNLSVDSITGTGWSEPMYWANESISQDDPGVKSSSSYIRSINLSGVDEVEVRIDSNGYRDDLDLFLYRDDDGDGQLDWDDELKQSSGGAASDETIVFDPADGQWWIIVHGYYVHGNNGTFWLSVKSSGGTQLQVTNHSEYNSSEVNALWPNASNNLGGEAASKAWQVNYTLTRPDSAGTWIGFIIVELQGGGEFRLEFEYDLLELPSEVLFLEPAFGSHHNNSVNVSALLSDSGAGFRLSNISFESLYEMNLSNHSFDLVGIYSDGSEEVLTGDYVESTSNPILSMAWFNFTLPEVEMEHHFWINLSDDAGYLTSSMVILTYDSTLPKYVPQGLGETTTLSNETEWELTIVGEANLDIEANGIVPQITLIDTATASELNLSIDASELWWYNMSIPLAYEGSNQIFINASDRAGNANNSSIVVVRDTVSPDLLMRSDATLLVVNTTIVEFQFKVEPGTDLWLSGMEIVNPDSLQWVNHEISTKQGSFEVSMVARDAAGNWAEAKLEFEVDSIMPLMQWLEPEVNASLAHHVVPIAWSLSEEVSMELNLDSTGWKTIPSGSFGRNSWVVELANTGAHEICLRATDSGRNAVISCLSVILPDSVYTPVLTAPWDKEWVNSSEVVAELYLGSGQTWQVEGESISLRGTGLGGVVNISIPINEGSNSFVMTAQGLGIEKTWQLSVYRDTLVPTLELLSPESRIALVKEDINPGFPLLTVEGVTEPLASVRCDVLNEGVWSQTTSAEDGTFSLGLTPWADWRDADIDSRAVEITCLAVDAAQNSVSEVISTVIDTSPPEVIIEWIGDLEELYLMHDIWSEDAVEEWNLTIVHDGKISEPYQELEMRSQIAMSGNLEGVWNATLSVRDSAGHWSNVSIEISLQPEEQGLGSILEAAGGPLNISIGILALAIIVGFILRPRREEGDIVDSVPMDPELFAENKPLQPQTEAIVPRVTSAPMPPTPAQSASLLQASKELLKEESQYLSILDELEEFD